MGNPEYAFWNIHKWLYGPKSAALMYVRSDRQLLHVPAPAVVDSTETQAFIDRFIWTGTRDRTAYCGEHVGGMLAMTATLMPELMCSSHC